MLNDAEFFEAKQHPRNALLHAADELALSTEALNGFINLVLDKGDGKSANVSFRRQGVANLLEPLLEQFSRAHSLVDYARKQLYPPSP